MLSAAYAAFTSDPAGARRQFKALAAGGDPRAQAAYALMLATGRGGGTDPTAAVHWYRSAAEQGHAEACHALGGMYLDGRGVAPDGAEARRWYTRAAALGDRDAMWTLGATSDDPEEASTWWRRAAARGHVGAWTSIGRALLGGGKVGEGAEALLEAATAGDEEALGELARALPAVREAAGRGEPAAAWVAAAFADDPAEAEALRALAERAGHGRACLRRAERMRRGDEPGGAAGAMELAGKAAAAGSLAGHLALALAWATGKGVARDVEAAVRAFRAAAADGSPEALRGLGASLLESWTTDAQREEMLDALHQAALGGDVPAMSLYASQIAEHDRVAAIRWLLEAADAGDPEAAERLRQAVAAASPADLRAADRASRTDGSLAEELLAGR